ncbi:extracellular solute-binding protein [Actinokineospora iranica]|uniref:N,N'-diacetylchitobiose transport system substrate-binding protein n=1 Tax=Actinokineospora iranica TaxID=1271860 RepID=A0A1G6RSG2_9PSEU|nr:extracellular solute-binding protein [Actinokineospora iranica]SDD07640.1 N,N'-diacetylchitobiose transport system substrate-binding protein [Actinokineospora iranica]
MRGSHAALASDDAPDVIEIGNTQAPKFAAAHVLLDLTGSLTDFNGDQWLPSLRDSATWDHKVYAMPFYAANRVVLYRTDLFAQAGVTPPTSRQDWLDAIAKFRAEFGADPDFQALYLPGQNWYTLLSFIYDEGGDIARGEGTRFTATLDSAEAKAGRTFYRRLVEASGTKAAKDADEQTPEQAGIYGGGKVAMFVGLPWEVAAAAKSDPTLAARTSAFPIPSKNAGATAPVFQGGSSLAIPASAWFPATGPRWSGPRARSLWSPATRTGIPMCWTWWPGWCGPCPRWSTSRPERQGRNSARAGGWTPSAGPGRACAPPPKCWRTV